MYIAAQARERLGFVMPGDIPYQVQLPPGGRRLRHAGRRRPTPANGDPWYTSLWHTIADAPHGVADRRRRPPGPRPRRQPVPRAPPPGG